MDGIRRTSPYQYNHSENNWHMLRPDTSWTTKIYPGPDIEDYFLGPHVKKNLNMLWGERVWYLDTNGDNSDVQAINDIGGGIALIAGDVNGNFAEIELGNNGLYQFKLQTDLILQFKGSMEDVDDVRGYVGLIDSTGNHFVRLIYDSSQGNNALFQSQNGAGNLTSKDTGFEVKAGEEWNMYLHMHPTELKLYSTVGNEPNLISTIATNISTDKSLRFTIRCVNLGDSTKEMHVHKLGIAMREI